MRYKERLSVSSFLLSTDLLYIKDKVLFHGSEKVLIKQDGYRISKYENIILVEFFLTDDGFERTLVCFSDNLKKAPVILNSMQRGRILENGLTVFLESDKEYNTYINVVDLNSSKKIWSILDIYNDFRLIDCKHILLINKQGLVAFNILKNIKLWQFSLSTLPPYKDIWGKEKPAEVIQILGIYDNVLWVHIANFRLIGIDVKKGELLHYFDNLLKGKSGNVFLDDLLGRIKILSYDYYGEFDLKTLFLIKEETVQCTDDVKIRASNFIKGDKNLYFCGYHNESLHPNAFGIFDTEKAEIIWYETTKDDLGYFYNPPQASEKLLAILDDKQNLLIYERD